MNQSAISKFRSKVQATMESMFPCTINVGTGETAQNGIVAATAGLKAGNALVVGGQLPDHEVVFRARLALFARRPKNGDRVTWVERNQTFRVQFVTDAGDSDPAILITCQSVTK